MINQDLKKFHESTTRELDSIKDRVRNIIGNKNWGEDGRYKEEILKNTISRFLPKNYSIGTGFVINKEKEVTKQLDIIVYNDESPVFFKEGDFVIVFANTVRAIAEVKTSVNTIWQLKEYTKTSDENSKKIISTLNKSKKFFNGIFAYKSNLTFDSIKESLKDYYFEDCHDFKINNITLGPNKFLHLWKKHPLNLSCYELKGLSYSYFISNLLSTIDSNPIFYENDPILYAYNSKEPFLKFSIEKTN